jgi:hypothetical protein
MHFHNFLFLNIISHFSHHNKLHVSFNFAITNDRGFTNAHLKNPMIFLRIAYKLHTDYNGEILGKVRFIFGQMWYTSTFQLFVSVSEVIIHLWAKN